jgi:hypothetical protein
VTTRPKDSQDPAIPTNGVINGLVADGVVVFYHLRFDKAVWGAQGLRHRPLITRAAGVCLAVRPGRLLDQAGCGTVHGPRRHRRKGAIAAAS